jgi:hypothetical protein
MQEENAENQNEYKGKKSVPDAEEAVPCWLNCFAGGAVVETGSCVKYWLVKLLVPISIYALTIFTY